jgi:hypothetical protein
MKYAIVDGHRREARHDLHGTCQACHAIMTPKCGSIRMPYWSHPPGAFKHHWEPETEWHRAWKNAFPEDCQEIPHRAPDGELHIADVKTPQGRVLEFQHSSLPDAERHARENYYDPMYWIVDGLRLQRDRPQFFEELRYADLVSVRPFSLIARASSLPQKWASSRVHVFFDFGAVEHESDCWRFGAPVLWAMMPNSPKGYAVLQPAYRAAFIDAMLKGKYPNGIVLPAEIERRLIMARVPQPLQSPPPRPGSFAHHMARKDSARRRVRF